MMNWRYNHSCPTAIYEYTCRENEEKERERERKEREAQEAALRRQEEEKYVDLLL